MLYFIVEQFGGNLGLNIFLNTSIVEKDMTGEEFLNVWGT